MAMQLDRAAIDEALTKATTTKRLILEAGALDRIGEIIAAAYPDFPVLIVHDDTTWELAGRGVQESLERLAHPLMPTVGLTGEPIVKPDLPNVATIRAAIEAAGQPVLPLAVGSGTLNDLTKRAAFEAGVPYAVFATAASMDGYTASGAALVAGGVKQTFACDAPTLVIADRDVIAAAPAPMTASGYGDLLGKVTAGADWLIADALGIEPIAQDAWEAVQGPLPALLTDSRRYASGDAGAIEQLFLALAGSGLAIQATGSSRPASGSEHQFSHLWEMRGLEIDGIPVSHGFKVGLGAIVSAALYERLLSRDLTTVDSGRLVATRRSWAEIEDEIHALHQQLAIVAKALEESRAKYPTDSELLARLTRLRDRWPGLRDRLRRHLMSPDELRDLLAGAGCPTTPEEIGLDRDQLRGSYAAATHIRRRYTVFDLAQDLGIFGDLVDELFTPEGYWFDAKARVT